MADDMRADVGCYYQGEDQPPATHPPMYTPNLDALASRSLLFKRAYVQLSLCNPSRTSMLTSRRPDTTKCHKNTCELWRTAAGNFTSLPQYFKENGYMTLGVGKIFHERTRPDAISWSRKFNWIEPDSHFYSSRRTEPWQSASPRKIAKKRLPDMQIADNAIKMLRKLAPKAQNMQQNFFLGVGFFKPHPPLLYPQKYEQYYQPSDMPLPIPKRFNKTKPRYAWRPTKLLGRPIKRKITNMDTIFPDDFIQNYRAGYYRSLSYGDAMIGRVLRELERLGLENSTVVAFISDHGWHLGEHGTWKKQSNFEMGVRVPLMIRAPGLTDSGLETSSLVEAVDLFPTVVELAGLPRLAQCVGAEEGACTEGKSMLPLFYNQTDSFRGYAFSQVLRNVTMGYTVRSDRYRYTRWVKYQQGQPLWGHVRGQELYDYREDQYETINFANDSEYQTLVDELNTVLKRKFINKTDDFNPEVDTDGGSGEVVDELYSSGEVSSEWNDSLEYFDEPTRNLSEAAFSTYTSEYENDEQENVHDHNDQDANGNTEYMQISWWRHQMETFSALLAICAGNSPVPGEFPNQRPVTRSFNVFFDLRPNKRLSKQSWGWWFETLSCSLWRHRNVIRLNEMHPIAV